MQKITIQKVKDIQCEMLLTSHDEALGHSLARGQLPTEASLLCDEHIFGTHANTMTPYLHKRLKSFHVNVIQNIGPGKINTGVGSIEIRMGSKTN